MAERDKPVFRKASLERLSTPDRLDQLVRVVKRRNWITLAGLGGVLLAALLWCVLGRIPVTIDGQAVVVRPKQVVPLHAVAPGTVVTLEVEAGDTVAAGSVIAILEVPALEQQLLAAEARLAGHRAAAKRRADRVRAEAEAAKADLSRRRAHLQARIESLQEQTGTVDEGAASVRRQIESLRQTAALSDEVARRLEKQRDAIDVQFAAGHANEVDRLAAHEHVIVHALRRAEIEARIQDLQARAADALARQRQQRDDLALAKAEWASLASEDRRVLQQVEDARAEAEAEEAAIAGTLARLRAEHDRAARLVAARDGTVLEVTVAPGSVVTAGQRIASLAAADAVEPLMALAYFDMADGRRMQAGMGVHVTPASVDRRRVGSIVGEVSRVSDYPVTTEAVLAQVGNREVAEQLLRGRGRIEVRVALSHDATSPSGLRWTSPRGAAGPILPGTGARVTVTLEERAPLTLLIPALRGWLGLD